MERLVVAIYAETYNFTCQGIETLSRALLRDQAVHGLELTRVQLVAHKKGIYAVGLGGANVDWSAEVTEMVERENEGLLRIAREVLGGDHDDAYREGAAGPISLVV